ncbi:MAG TPA: SgcJ/EcaC family oxidoreductase [Bryobacteraceae bacterium]|nr:SgcJ/EcaC family oxidoreductase [Bryobacteraceae bacterium]
MARFVMIAATLAGVAAAALAGGLWVAKIRHAHDLAQIQELHARDVAASKAADFETLKSLFTDDAVVMPPASGFVRGRSAIARNMAKVRETLLRYEVVAYHEDFEELKIFGDEALEWGTIHGAMRVVKTGHVEASSYKVMRILRKQPNGEWRIARSIYNDIPSAPAQ